MNTNPDITHERQPATRAAELLGVTDPDGERDRGTGDDQCRSVSPWGTVCTVGKAAHAADPRIAHSDSNGDQWFRGPLDDLLAGGYAVTYAPDPVWEGGWFADLRYPSGHLAECGNGATQAEALADLARRIGGAR